MEPTRGTFLVTHTDDESAILRDVVDGQLHTLSSNPGVDRGDVLHATLEPDLPLAVIWELVDLEECRSIELGESEEPPTRLALDAASEQELGDVTRIERAGTGEIHVISVPPGRTERAVADVLADEETIARAARLGVERVDVRSTPGVVSVRYLP